MVFQWCLSDNKSSRVSRTLLSILADRTNAVVWRVSTRSLISKFFSLCTNPLVTVPSTPTTTGITITFIFHSFSILKQSLGIYLSFRFLSVLLCGQPERQSALFGKFSFFCLTITKSGRLAKIK